ncbi:LysR family transcriptional regulator [Alcaligenaceae bacterium B3P038]|nr:LysR family transcriptional regulator [Alcaligenaceae bacterium B3P038]
MNPTDLFASLPDMAVFARVVDAGNFSLAARQLGSTPSTVSRQIKRLEQTLGARLLERSTRHIRLTEAGAQVYRHCHDMLNAANGAVDAAGNVTARPHGRVRLSAPTAFAKTVLHPLVPDFLQRYPEVDVQLMFTDREADPLVDDLDLLIRLTERPPPGLAGRALGNVKWMLCASPAYLEKRGVPRHPQDLAGHDCLYLGETTDDNCWRLRRGQEVKTVAVKGRYIANHAGARLEAALSGLGIANLPDFSAEDALAQGGVVRVLPEWALDAGAYMGAVWLLYPPKRALPPKVRVLIDYLVECLEARHQAI